MAGSIQQQHQEIERALAHPTLTLLRNTHAALVLTALSMVFDESTTWVECERLHGVVDAVRACLGEFDEQPPEDRRSAREVCTPWLQGERRWLTRYTDPDSHTQRYRITPEASQALAFVGSLTRDQVVTTGTTVQTLLDIAHACALRATTDPVQRRRRLEDRRAALQAELALVEQDVAELERSGVVTSLDDEAMVLNEFLRVRQLSESLLRGLRGVEQGVKDEGERLRRDFADDQRPTGEVVQAYRQQLERLLDASREGQGFANAQRLLDDPTTRERLREDIATIQAHPAVAAHPERLALNDTVGNIHRATGAVLDARTTIHTAFTRYVQSRDATQRRALPRAVTALQATLDAWERQAGRRRELPVAFPLPRVEIATLRVNPGRGPRRSTLAPPRPPAPVELAAEVSRVQGSGGAHVEELREAVSRALAHHRVVGAQEVFAELDQADSRPADLWGLVNLAFGCGAVTEGEELEWVTTVRPDGSTRRFGVPRLAFTTAPQDGTR